MFISYISAAEAALFIRPEERSGGYRRQILFSRQKHIFDSGLYIWVTKFGDVCSIFFILTKKSKSQNQVPKA
jgi:hypothetical protein